MTVITSFLDVVAGVSILAGRSSLLDTSVFKTANSSFSIRQLLAVGFIGVGGWNLWNVQKAQNKLKKTLGAESFSAESGQMCEVCFGNDDLPYDSDHFTEWGRCEKSVCMDCDGEMKSHPDWFKVCGECNTVLENVSIHGAESFGAEADSDNIIRFKVGEQYEHRYHHGYGFRDNEIMRRTDKTVWTSQVNPETGKVDYPQLVSRHKIHTAQPFELDGKIVLGRESYGLGNHAYRVRAGDTSLRTYGAESFGAETPCSVMVWKDGALTECGWWNEKNEPCVYHPDGKEINAESFSAESACECGGFGKKVKLCKSCGVEHGSFKNEKRCANCRYPHFKTITQCDRCDKRLYGAESLAAESFSHFNKGGLEFRTVGMCGCEQDELWEVVNVESPVFLCGTCGYAGNKKEDGHFMHMKNIYDAESFSAEGDKSDFVDKCYSLYQKHGQDAVLEYAELYGDEVGVVWETCEPCEWVSPILDGECLVCGHDTTVSFDAESFSAESDSDKFWEMLHEEHEYLFDENGMVEIENKQLAEIAKEMGFDDVSFGAEPY